jgi:hypothetical protein
MPFASLFERAITVIAEPYLTNSNGSFWRTAAVSAGRRFFRRRDARSDQLRVLGEA